MFTSPGRASTDAARPARSSCLIAAVTATILVAGCGSAVPGTTSGSSAAQSTAPVQAILEVSQRDDESVAAQYDVAGVGPIAVGSGGTIWVVDRAEGELDDNGDPKGTMWQLDTATGTKQATIEKVSGGDVVIVEDTAYLSSFALDRVLMADLSTGKLTRTVIGDRDDEGVDHLLLDGNTIWVSGHHAGTVVQLELKGTIKQTVEVSAADISGPQGMVLDGGALLVALNEPQEIVRVNTSDGGVAWRQAVPAQACGVPAFQGRTLFVPNADCEGGRVILLLDARSGAFLGSVTLEGAPTVARSIDGVLWVLTYDPDQLLRVDPDTLTAVAISLPSPPEDVVSDGTMLWVRCEGKVLGIRP